MGLVIKRIDDFKAPELEAYARLSEAELYHYYEPHGGLFVAESPNVIERALAAGYEPVSFLMEERHLEGAMAPVLKTYGFLSSEEKTDREATPIYTASLDVLNQLTGFGMTRGVLAVMKRRPLPAIGEICAGKSRIAVLEEVMNPTNVGAIFRSAAALGMEAVILTAGSSDPLYRRAARVSMGTVFQVPWTQDKPKRGQRPMISDDRTEIGALESGTEKLSVYSRLRELGFKTAAMALCENSIDLAQESEERTALINEEKLAIVLGTEGDGLAAQTIEACDYTVRIPMSAGVDSLNVAAASAVAFWEMRRR